jgi:hypothetical protein
MKRGRGCAGPQTARRGRAGGQRRGRACARRRRPRSRACRGRPCWRSWCARSCARAPGAPRAATWPAAAARRWRRRTPTRSWLPPAVSTSTPPARWTRPRSRRRAGQAGFSSLPAAGVGRAPADGSEGGAQRRCLAGRAPGRAQHLVCGRGARPSAQPARRPAAARRCGGPARPPATCSATSQSVRMRAAPARSQRELPQACRRRQGAGRGCPPSARTAARPPCGQGRSAAARRRKPAWRCCRTAPRPRRSATRSRPCCACATTASSCRRCSSARRARAAAPAGLLLTLSPGGLPVSAACTCGLRTLRRGLAPAHTPRRPWAGSMDA